MTWKKQKLAEAKKKLANAELHQSFCVIGAIIFGSLMLIFIVISDGGDTLIWALLSLMGMCVCVMFLPTGKDSPASAKLLVERCRSELRQQDAMDYQQEMMEANRNRERIQAEEEKQRGLELAANLLQEGGLANLQEVLKIYSVTDVVSLDKVSHVKRK